MSDPDRFDYLPITNRPIIQWPNGARVALWIVPNVEHLEFLPPRYEFRNPWPRTPHPDVALYGQYEYGNRFAFWRMLEVFDQHRVRATASLNEAVLEHFPEVRDAMVARDWDYMSHGLYNTRYFTQLTVEEERGVYQDLIATLHKHTGKRLKGILTPAISPSENTPDLLAEAGLIYHADWLHDDEPFPLKVKTGRLISMPYAIDINDGHALWGGYPPSYWAQCLMDQFDVLYEEGIKSGRAMCMSLHPFLCAHPSRIKYLDDVFSYILGHDGIWQATADEIAEYYIANYYDEVNRLIESFRKAQLADVRSS